MSEVVSLADVEPEEEDFNFAKGFSDIQSIPPKVARSIVQRVRIFMDDASGRDAFKDYVQRARITHAMIEDYKARTARDPDDRKKAAETFLKLTDAIIAPKRPTRPAKK